MYNLCIIILFYLRYVLVIVLFMICLNFLAFCVYIVFENCKLIKFEFWYWIIACPGFSNVLVVALLLCWCLYSWKKNSVLALLSDFLSFFLKESLYFYIKIKTFVDQGWSKYLMGSWEWFKLGASQFVRNRSDCWVISLVVM